MKTNNPITKSLIAVLLVALVATGGCKNFMSNNDDFKKTIQTEVAVANADQVPVRVITDSQVGSTSPAGQVTEKVGVAFSLLMTLDSNYGFVRWAAYSTTDLATELGSEVVSFGDKTALETTATIHVTRGDIQIQPVCEKRSKVSSTSPASGEKGVYRNVPLKIYFSKKMNASSFAYDDGTKRSSAGLFKNVTINGYVGTDASAAMEKYFKDPTLDEATGTILSFSPTAERIPAYTNLTVEVSKSVVDTLGLPMSDSYTFTYKYGSGDDTSPPTVTSLDIGAAEGVGYTKNAGYSYPRTNNVNTWIMITATDTETLTGGKTKAGSGLDHVNVLESHAYDANGNAGQSGDSSTYTTALGSDSDGVEYPFAYTMKVLKDGLIQVVATVTDATGNTSSATATSTYSFVRDTTPPNVAANASNLAMSNLADRVAGYFNADKHTLKFTSSAVDYGATAYCALPADVKVRFQIVDGSDSAWSDWGSSANWAAGGTYQLVIPATWADGTVTVNYQLKDDLDNVSGVGTLGTVLKDTNPPTGSITVTETKEHSAVKTIGGKPYVNSLNLNVSVASSDGTGSGTTYYEALGSTASPSSIATPIAANTKSIDGVTLNAATGALTVYAWFKDSAGNANSSPATSTTVYYDATPPAITKFWVNPSSSADVSDEQYSSGTTLFFGFIAKDVPAGVATFKYKDSYGESQTFDIPAPLSWTGTQGSGNYLVSSVNRVDNYLGVDGQVLVTGKLTIPATPGPDTIKLILTDMLGNATDDATVNCTANSVVYDAKAPTVTLSFPDAPASGNYASPYYNNGSTLFTSRANLINVKVTAQDSPNASEVVSGAYNYDLSGDVLTSVSKAVLSGAAHRDSGLKTSTESVTLSGGDGTKALAATARDYALNSSGANASIVLDTLPPTFAMGIRSSGGTSDLITKDAATANRVLDSTTTTYKAMSAFDLYVSASDAGSGVPDGNYTWNLLKGPAIGGTGTSVGTGTIPLSGGSGHVAIPGISGSGRYWVSLKLKDNLANEGATNSNVKCDENTIGFVYDNTAPTVVAVKACDSSGTPWLEKYDKTWFTGSEVYLKAQATDDTNGSGIKTITVHSTTNATGSTMDTRSYVKGTNIVDDTGTTITYDPGNTTTWFFLKNWDGTGSNPVHPKFSGLSTAPLRLYVTFTDAMGNAQDVYSDTSPLYIKADNDAPYLYDSSSSGFLGTSYGYVAGRRYLRSSGAAHFNATINDDGCGVKRWALESSTDKSAWTTSAWQASPGNSTDDASKNYDDTTLCRDSTTLLPDGAPKYLRPRMEDYLGNTEYYNGTKLLATDIFQMDNTAPDASGLAVVSTPTAAGASPSSVATNNNVVTLTFTVNETGSGIAGLTFSGLSSITSVSDSTGKTATIASASSVTYSTASGGLVPGGSAVTFTVVGKVAVADGLKTITVTPTDAVGNAGNTLTANILYDGSAPTGTSIDVNGGDHVLSGTAKANVTVKYNEATSGVQKIKFSGGAFVSLSGVTVYKGGTVTSGGCSGGDQITGFSISGDTLTFNSSLLCAANGTWPSLNTQGDGSATTAINICGVTLAGTMHSGETSGTLVATVTDNATNTGSDASITTLSRDSIAPVISSTPTFESTSTDSKSGYTITNTIKTTITYKEEDSGLNTFIFTGVEGVDSLLVDGVDSGTLAISFTSGGSPYSYRSGKLSVTTTGSGDTAVTKITIKSGNVYPKSSGGGTNTVTITGLNVTTEGLRTMSVQLQDSATNPSTVSATSTITLDTVKPSAPTINGTPARGTLVGDTYYYKATNNDIAATINESSDSSGVKGYCTTGLYADATTSLTFALSTTSTIYAFDNAGNSNTLQVKVVHDTAAPIGLKVTSPSTGAYPAMTDASTATTFYTTADSIEFTPSASDSVSTLKGYNTDGSENVTVTPGNNITLSASTGTGTTTNVYAVDKAGNATAALSITVIKDGTPPSALTISGTPARGTLVGDTYYYKATDSNISVTINASSDPGAGTFGSGMKGYCTTGVYADATSTQTFTCGSGTTTIYAFDNAGNSTTLAVKVAQDAVPPSAPTINGTPVRGTLVGDTYYYKATDSDISVTINESSDTGGSGMKGYCTTGLYADATTSLTFALSTTSTIYAFDNAGNSNTLLVKVVHDTAAPTGLKVTSPVTGAYPATTDASAAATFYTTGDSIEFTPSASDSVSTLKGYNTDGSENVTVTPGNNITLSASTGTGTTTNVYAVDKAGNATAALPITVIKDGTPPSALTISGTPARGTLVGDTYYYKATDSNISVTINASSDPGAGTFGSGMKGYCTTGVYADATSTQTFTCGSGTTTIYAFDNAGNPTTLAVKVAQDAVPPSAPTINGTPVRGTLVGDTYYYKATDSDISVTINESSDTGGSGMKGYCTTGLYADATTSLTFALSTTSTIYAFDNAGNSNTLLVKVVHDTAAPTGLKVTSPVTGAYPATTDASAAATFYTTGDSIEFTPSASDSVSTLKGYNTDGSENVTVTPGNNITLSASTGTGTTTNVYAVDKAGNATAALPITVIKDGTPPSALTISGTPARGTLVGDTYYYKATDSNISVTINASSDPGAGTFGSGMKGYCTTGVYADATSTQTFTCGSGTTTIYAFDNAGNSTTLAVKVAQDAVPPSAPTINGTPVRGTLVGDTYYYKATDSDISVTINESSDTGGSGMKGYCTTGLYADATTSLTFALSTTSTIYAFDNAGNSNTLLVKVVHDTAAPTFNTLTSGMKLRPSLLSTDTGGSGLKTVTISPSGSWTISSSSNDTISDLGTSYTGTITAEDYAGNATAKTLTISGTTVTMTSVRASGNPLIDERLSQQLVVSALKKKAMQEKLYGAAVTATGLVSWSEPELTAKSIALTDSSALYDKPIAADMTVAEETSLDFSTLSIRHAQALALARSQFVASQNTDAAQNGADKKISPETANNVKQDDSGRSGGVGYNQEYVRLACNAMAPLAEQYFASHGVQLVSLSDVAVSGGSVQSAILQASSQHDSGQSNGLPSGPGIGILMNPKVFWVFRREQGIGMVS